MTRLLFRFALFFALATATRAASPGLASSASAFLRAGADSPVNWMVWGDEAFARAKQEQKPVFLAVGAFTSELSRAMARQSFANPETAKFLNDTFICVLVDAKEQPDVAALSQSYLRAVKQMNGLPANLWLTPELKPFEGANYLPPTDEWGKEGFNNTSKRVAAAWKADPAAMRHKADEALAAIGGAERSIAPESIDTAGIAQLLTSAVEGLRPRFDATHGGFGDPPKYPEPELLRFLLHDVATREMALTTLRAIINGALRDPLDGGFSRYVSDAEWHQPYFQKTLGDQARLALALLDAAEVSGDAQFAEAARGALAYALDRLGDTKHEFAAAEDATSAELTATYFWTAGEIGEVLGDPAAGKFSEAYGVTAAGNLAADAFPGVVTAGKNILLRSTLPGDAAVEKSLAQSAAKLLQRRLQRPAPLRDEVATSGAHGLMLTALARGGKQLNDSRFVAAAKAQAAFIGEHLRASDSGLLHLAGQPGPATPQDYAFVVQGLLTFHAQTADTKAKTLALDLIATVGARLWDKDAGRYFAIYDATAPGFWARVHSPAPGAGDAPTAEAAMLAALAEANLTDGKIGDIRGKLLPTVAAELKDAGEMSRGDLLLALQLAQKKN